MEVHAFLVSSLRGGEPNKSFIDPFEERAPFPNLQRVIWIPEPLGTLWMGRKYPRRVSNGEASNKRCSCTNMLSGKLILIGCGIEIFMPE